MTNCVTCTFRSAAAVEVVTRELKMRTTNVNMPRPPETVGGPRGGKRKRTAAPEETCPYCNHIYTVRDGLSTKTDLEGNRYTPHLALCVCVCARVCACVALREQTCHFVNDCGRPMCIVQFEDQHHIFIVDYMHAHWLSMRQNLMGDCLVQAAFENMSVTERRCRLQSPHVTSWL